MDELSRENSITPHAIRYSTGHCEVDDMNNEFDLRYAMASPVTNILCDFCGLTQAASQPHCAGCGAALPLPTGKHQADRKLLELATRMNALLARENSRMKTLGRRTGIWIGMGMICTGVVLVALVTGASRMHSTVIAEGRVERDIAVQQRYTRALEMELYGSSGELPSIELE